MQRIWPPGNEDTVDLAAVMSDRSSWLAVNFVMSLDGAVTRNGVSGPLGGEGDRQLFLALRDRADVVMAGAGTVRGEDYGPTNLRAQHLRLARGQQPRATLVVVTRSGDLADQDRLWQDPDAPIVVVAGTRAPETRLAAIRDRGGEVVVVPAAAGSDDPASPDLAATIGMLAARGLARVLCEGGPTLFNDLLDAGLVTDTFTTVGSLIAGGGRHMVPRRLDPARRLELVAVRRHGDEVLLHHRVTGAMDPAQP